LWSGLCGQDAGHTYVQEGRMYIGLGTLLIIIIILILVL
jgi:hypothetical protein